MKSLWYNFKYGIYNLITWFKIVWANRDWDYHYILTFLEFKLKLMEKELKNDTWHSDVGKTLDTIYPCLYTLKRIIEDDYCKLEYEKLDKKWGLIELGGTGFFNKNVITKEDENQYHKEFMALADKEQYLLNQDLNFFFETFKKHYRKWWT